MACGMCGMSMGNDQEQNKPEEIRQQIQTLQHKLNDLEQGKTTPQQMEQQTQHSGMCPMCASMMSGMGSNPSKQEMEQGIEHRIQGLEQRVNQLEHAQS